MKIGVDYSKYLVLKFGGMVPLIRKINRHRQRYSFNEYVNLRALGLEPLR